jgi:hypothetical protein
MTTLRSSSAIDDPEAMWKMHRSKTFGMPHLNQHALNPNATATGNSTATTPFLSATGPVGLGGIGFGGGGFGGFGAIG